MRGLCMAGLMFATLSVAGLILHSEHRIGQALNRSSVTDLMVGAAELVAATVCLWLTARKWARYLAAVVFVGAARAITAWLIAMRPEAAIGAAYMVAGGILTLRFATRKPTRGETAALILFVLATAAQFISGTWIPGLLIGMSALVAARFWPAVSRRLGGS